MKAVLITGATSGIGEALAHLYSKKGYALILTGRNEEKLKAMKGLSGVKTTLPLDLAKKEEQKRLQEEIRATCPDIVINNAGLGAYGEAISISLQEQLNMMEVNCNAVVSATISAANALKEAGKRGVILNVSSLAAFHPGPWMAVYSASKAFVLSFSKSLDLELKGEGIRVLTACPGMVQTAFSDRAGGKVNPHHGGVMTAEKAALEIFKQIQQEKRTHAFDAKSAFASFVARHLIPDFIVGKIIQKSIEERL